jgi:uroporphyrinogen III methyltransferase/synthase
VTHARPLTGRRVLVTRPAHQSATLRRRLRDLGGEVVEAPAIRLVPPEDPGVLDAALSRLTHYTWLVLTSPNGARVLLERFAAAGRAPLDGIRVAAIGPATAGVLRAARVRVDVMPADRYQAEGLLGALSPLVRAGDRVLVLRAAEARPVLPERLRALGAEVEVVSAYRTLPGDIDVGSMRGALSRGEIDAATFTSGSTVRHFVAAVGADAFQGPRRPRTVCLGAVTAAAAEAAGIPVDRVAERATVGDLVAAVVHELSDGGGG